MSFKTGIYPAVNLTVLNKSWTGGIGCSIGCSIGCELANVRQRTSFHHHHRCPYLIQICSMEKNKFKTSGLFASKICAIEKTAGYRNHLNLNVKHIALYRVRIIKKTTHIYILKQWNAVSRDSPLSGNIQYYPISIRHLFQSVTMLLLHFILLTTELSHIHVCFKRCSLFGARLKSVLTLAMVSSI